MEETACLLQVKIGLSQVPRALRVLEIGVVGEVFGISEVDPVCNTTYL